MKHFGQKASIGLTSAALVIAASMSTSPAYAANLTGTHYIDNAASSCSDSGSGTMSTPWCTFTPANGSIFGPGSQLLLKRGDTFKQALTPAGAGSSSSWITIGAYGTGSRPIITGNGNASDRTVVLTNPDYWRVQDLELSNAGEGIFINYTSTGHTGLDFERIYAHDIQTIFHGSPTQADDPRLYNSSAITIDIGGAPSPSAASSTVSNVTIRQLEAYHTAAIYLVGTAAGAAYPTQPSSAISNVSVSEVYSHQSAAPALAFEPVSNLHFVSNYVDCSGHVAEAQGTTCNFVYDVTDSTFANNVFINMNHTGSPDESAIDVEGDANNVRIVGNFFGNNAGPGVEYLNFKNGAPNTSANSNTNNLLDSNAFYNNGGTSVQKGQVAIYSLSGEPPAGGTISNNVYSDSPTGFLNSANGSAQSSNFTATNNNAVSTEYLSAFQYSGSQGSSGWRQQAYTGSGSWTDLTSYDATANQWNGTDGSSVGNFELQPGPTNRWVSRTWVAPAAGSLRIRGQVFKDAATGDGVKVLIERNGTAVWPSNPDYYSYKSIAASDVDGMSSDIDLIVAAGDTIRFVVNSGPNNDATGDLVSWVPSISYN